MRFVFFSYNDGYQKYVLDCAKSNGALITDIGSDNRILRLYKLHNNCSLNKFIELPMKKIWFDKCLEEDKLNVEDDICFIFYESFHFSYSLKYLKHLKRKFLNGKFCFVFTNPANEYNIKKYNAVRTIYDITITFSEKDAVQNEWLYYPCDLGIMQLPIFKINNAPENDLFFVGREKGRLSFLLSIYEKMTEMGLKCDFHIMDVPKAKQKYSDIISYNKKITYNEVLKRTNNSKCVLEVIMDGYDYSSIRTNEAIQYGKLLMTTNRKAKELAFYSPDVVSIISSPKDIDGLFFDKKFPVVYPYQKWGCYKDFYDFILSKF